MSSQQCTKIELQDEFVIGAFASPPSEETTLERYQEVAELGLDILIPANGVWTPELNNKALDLAEQVGIRVIPLDMTVMAMGKDKETPPDRKAIEEYITLYGSHPATAGYVVRDEPNADMFPHLRAMADIFRELDPGHEPYINLYPGYGSPAQLGFDDYRAYVRDFIETVEPGILSYDNYPLHINTTTFDNWYHDLEIIREEARRAEIPFWLFMQAQGIVDYLRVPSEIDIAWQVNSSLCYGVRGIMWFSYWTPMPELFPSEDGLIPFNEVHHDAIITLEGKRSPHYEYVKTINAFAHQVGPQLLEWDNEQVTRVAAGEQAGLTPVWLAPQLDEGKLVIGVYRKGEHYRVIYANDDLEAAANLTLARKSTPVASHRAEALKAGTWLLQPGGAVVVEY